VGDDKRPPNPHSAYPRNGVLGALVAPYLVFSGRL